VGIQRGNEAPHWFGANEPIGLQLGNAPVKIDDDKLELENAGLPARDGKRARGDALQGKELVRIRKTEQEAEDDEQVDMVIVQALVQQENIEQCDGEEQAGPAKEKAQGDQQGTHEHAAE